MRTTLLAQIDSAIGGKVAVDLPNGKNLIGAFYQPRLVWTDIAVLKKLPTKQVCNGLAEAVKYGIIRDKALFVYMERNYQRILEPKVLMHIVERCSRIKAEVVRQDEREIKGIRSILNFGHTIGHAVEAASHYRYDHGEAVALGMRVALEISVQMKMLKPVSAQRVNRLLDHIELPRKIEKVSLRNVLAVMEHDKKFKAGKNRFVLATKIGRVKLRENIPLPLIRLAVKKLF